MSVKDDSAPLMILEYMPYGDLQGFLEDHRQIFDTHTHTHTRTHTHT